MQYMSMEAAIKCILEHDEDDRCVDEIECVCGCGCGCGFGCMCKFGCV